ncbi:MAG: hypothetical protein WDO68_16625 [Gammaproteobacteria bacterium]
MDDLAAGIARGMYDSDPAYAGVTGADLDQVADSRGADRNSLMYSAGRFLGRNGPTSVGDGSRVSMAGKTYTTYTRKNESAGKVYSGRTSGKGTAEQQVKARTSAPDHEAKTREGYGPAKVDKNSPNADAIRGREQQLIEQNGGAQSTGGTSGNTINGVSPNNPNAQKYEQACQGEFPCKQ